MWLGLSGCENNYDLIVSNRLRLVTSHLPRPDTQRPSLVVLVGGRAKSIALHAMFGVRIAQPATGSPGSNEIHLHLAPQTSFHERPVLLAEGHLYNSHARVVPTTCPQDARRQAIIWTAQSGMERRVTGELYCRLLAPFADVFCFFCDDLDGGLEGVARHLATWLDHGPQAQNPANAHPKIVVVSSTVLHGVQGEAKAKTDLLAMLEKETRRETSNLSAYISFVTVLPHTSVSATARYRALKERIMRISDDVRQSRVDARCLFSATHVAALLDGACDHFASASDLPFDLVQESRRRNPVPENLESHVTEFVGRGTPQTELVTFAMPVIGSSLFLDAYPPGAHLFDPVDVFEGLYSDMLNRAFSNESMPLGRDGSTCMPSDGLIQLVKAHFYGLSCGHVHCEACVWDYGRPSDEDPWVTLYGQCHLCDTLLSEEAVIRRHPPTAGVGVFCLDGGGVRGIVSLEILKRIHEAIKLPIPLTRFIKIFFGISLPVATIDKKPLERIFTNYNGVGKRPRNQGRSRKRALVGSHIYDVGSFQDAGPLVDPTLSALCEVTALFPLLVEPDFVVSIGTGESQPSNAAATEDLRGVLGNGAVPRLGRLFWEKMGDKKVKQMLGKKSRHHRLNVYFDGDEPMLDNAPCMAEMGERARNDPLLTEPIAYLRRCMLASLFYFELDALPERCGGRLVGTGTMLCTIRKSELGFQDLFLQLSTNSVQIVVDGSPLCGVNDLTCFDRGGNFRKLIKVDSHGRLEIALREGSAEPCHISRSPFAIDQLVTLQGLDAVFGRRACRKRKSACADTSPRKRRAAV
ncbi:phospholipase [Verticillium dahliae VdLs.17]|uniref:Phospholipase n=1 Tax=Verticillium dahliae (strain VdLs.17 / ATCC MYA-4575 / FGSC 10137) TaxID=498257 RepID=G2X393_VERDV|nr:phospholipase [Verticillium dahliae VdLs.17]EGY23440.1 phospholipase [Verticillium dahliae VdLs.17]